MSGRRCAWSRLRRRVQHPRPDPGESARKLEVLRRHCEAIGRDVGSIEKTALVEADLRPGRQRPSDVVAALRAQAAEGIDHVIGEPP